jgi:mono/diheme cytochrome c family protein
MRIRIVAVAGAALLVAAAAGAEEKTSLRAVGEGRALFVANCAGCHGSDARGKVGPDLTALSLRNGGFDRRYVANHIHGRRDGMGGQTMPAWGVALQHSWPYGRSGAALKTYKLTRYLESIQAVPGQLRASGQGAPR